MEEQRQPVISQTHIEWQDKGSDPGLLSQNQA